MDKFSLKWNDFQSNVSKTFADLRGQSSLFDVTLVGSDQKQVAAHRLVLSACSEFFKKIFKNIDNQSNLVLYLDSVSTDELSLILDYAYLGEVQIYQDKLDRFLEVSEKYQLDGLNVNESENFIYSTDKFNKKVEESTNIEIVPPAVVDSRKKPSIVASNNFNESFIANNSEIDAKYEELVVKDNEVFRCTVCGRTNKYRCNMRRHIETHLTGLSYECDVCQKSFRSTHGLATHKTKCNRHFETSVNPFP